MKRKHLTTKCKNKNITNHKKPLEAENSNPSKRTESFLANHTPQNLSDEVLTEAYL